MKIFISKFDTFHYFVTLEKGCNFVLSGSETGLLCCFDLVSQFSVPSFTLDDQSQNQAAILEPSKQQEKPNSDLPSDLWHYALRQCHLKGSISCLILDQDCKTALVSFKTP